MKEMCFLVKMMFFHVSLSYTFFILFDFQNQWLRIDMGEFYSVRFIALQGHPNTNSYVKTFYLKYSPDGWRWSIYGYNPPTSPYKVCSSI